MASVYDLAKLSSMTYDATKVTFSDWMRRDSFGNSSGAGFYAEMYIRIKSREVVIAIRGTDGGDKDWSDFYSGIQLGLGKTPSQLKQAEEAYNFFLSSAKRRLGDTFDLYVTGHSLGGGLASLLSARKSGLPTVTFNAPGMQRSYIGGHLISIIGHVNLAYVNTSQMLHIRATGDLVSQMTGKHMGTIEEVYVDHWGGGDLLDAQRYLNQHSIENMVSALKSKFHYQKDLGYKSGFV